MQSVINFFKNRVVISIIGLLILSALIWFVGPAFKFGEKNYAPLGGETARLLTIIIMIVLWGLNNLRVQRQENKNNDELVTALQDNPSAESNDILSDQTSEEMQQIGERFTHALTTLKKLKFKGRGKTKALYELPWYIIIGPPGSGKTTALINSSLNFPLAEQFGKGALHGVGGTRNCDWWFTNDAVLIDTAGRYTTQDSHKVVDSSAWEGFLTLLKKHRRRRPINGAIIAISLQDLLIQTEEERIIHANTIRSRIDELMEKLEIRFPIYLMFTKCDLVSGFSEFFEDMGRDDREQVWGISLPNAPKYSQSPDFEFLDNEYRNIIKRLYERVLWRVHQERDVRRRGAIQGFPQQMENLKGIVEKFTRQAFIKNRFRYQPYLRGIYFTSGTQDGTPVDRLMSSVSSNFGFNREVMAPPMSQGKSYFLGQLFRDVIFPESELVGSNRRYEKFITWSKRSAYVAMAGIAVVMSVVWAGSFTRNEMYMQEVESYITEFNTGKKKYNIRTGNIYNTLPALNALAKASVVYDQEEHPWLSALGMYDSNVDDAANAAYYSQLENLFLPKLMKQLETHLKRGHRGGDLYSTFRTYVMFNKLAHMDKQLVKNWFSEKWKNELEGQATKRQELLSHLGALLSLDLEPEKLNKQIVSSTRSLLLRVPASQRIYERIRTNPVYTQKIDLLNEFGESVRDNYITTREVQMNLSIPILFTKEAYDDIDFSSDSEIISSITSEKWLLSDDDQARVDFIKDDLGEVSEQVKDHYLSEYNAVWKKVYGTLNVEPFENLKHANDVLINFTDPVYSPMLAILEVGSNNTELSSQLAANLEDDNKEGVSGELASLAATKVPWTKVDREFRSINVMLRESSRKPAPISSVLLKVSQLQEFVNEITLAPDPAKKAFEVAKVRYQSGAGNAISSLHAFAKNTPKPIERWLTTLADETWRVILRSAHQHVNSEWKSTIYRPYRQALAGRYPLTKSSKDELALLDFIDFFKPGGTIDVFREEYIKPFISTRNGWKNRSIDKYNLGLSQQSINQVKRALAIQKIYFRNNAEIPSLTFQLKPYLMGKNDVRFELEVGENNISYSHGPKFWKTLTWVGSDDKNRVRIIFEDLNERQYSRAFDGPWAWFKLLDQSKLSKTKKSNVYLITYNITDEKPDTWESSPLPKPIKHEITYQIKAKSVNNPLKNNLLSAFKLRENI
ncbi:MAG: type VI secretion system membrane subunit TssM [Gammaproteobacteria bacterium]|nr:type VI secretion system membrane subunit TssM [Gammaproteobacteria bacterium]